jgi:mRNA interferase HigB
VNVISKPGLIELLQGKSEDVHKEAMKWYTRAKESDWASFASVREVFPNSDLVGELLVFNIRGDRYRLIVFPVFSRRKLYIKALLTHKEYDREEWKKQWP